MSLLLRVTPATTDAATVNLALTPSAVEFPAKETVDANTETFALTPSSTDIAQYVDAATETFAFTPSDSQAFAGVDSDTQYLYLEPQQASVEDDFDDNVLSTKYWTAVSNATEVNQRLEFTGTFAQVILWTSKFWTPFPAEVSCKVVGFDNAATNTVELLFASFIGLGARIKYTGTTITAVIIDANGNDAASGSVTSFTGDVWFKMVRTFPGVSLQYSTNGTSWTTICSVAVDFLWMRRGRFTIDATDNTKSGSFLSAIDNFKLVGSLTDIEQFVESQTVGLALTPSAIEEHTTYDAETELFKLTPSGTDDYTAGAADYMDANTEVLALVPSATETGQSIDAAIESFSLVPSGSDIFTGADAATETFALTPSTLDIADYVDSGREDFSLTPSADESLSGQTFDTATELFSLVPSRNEIAQFADTNVGGLILTPSSDDFKVIFDSATETLSLIPSSIDIGEFADVLTALLKLTPSGVDVLQTAMGEDAETLYLHLTPGGIEVLKFIKLVGVLLQHYSGEAGVRYGYSKLLRRRYS